MPLSVSFLEAKEVRWQCVECLGSRVTSNTEDPRYSDRVCYQRFCCTIEFAVITKLDYGLVQSTNNGYFLTFFFYKSYVLCIC